MAEYLVIVIVGLVAFADGQWWVILIGALGLSMGAWFEKERPTVPFDWNIAMFFAAVYCNGLIACSGSYLIGILGRTSLG